MVTQLRNKMKLFNKQEISKACVTNTNCHIMSVVVN
jgi:hypothetical protein